MQILVVLGGSSSFLCSPPLPSHIFDEVHEVFAESEKIPVSDYFDVLPRTLLFVKKSLRLIEVLLAHVLVEGEENEV